MSRLIDNPNAGRQEKKGFEERGEILGLAVAIKVIAVRRFSGEPDGQKSHHGSDEIQAGVGRFGEDAKATGSQSDDDLENGETDSRNDRSQGRSFLFMSAILREIRDSSSQLILPKNESLYLNRESKIKNKY